MNQNILIWITVMTKPQKAVLVVLHSCLIAKKAELSL